MNDFAWRPVLAQDIKVGNLVSCFSAKRPRYITRIEIVDSKITFYENEDQKVYLKDLSSDHPIDLLINCKTLLPATTEKVST
jgi:hypothetical protein